MRSGRRAVITGEQREELWRRYEAGETILGIGRALGQGQTAIHRVLQSTGGIAPTVRSRSPRVLSFGEREEISCVFHAMPGQDSDVDEPHRSPLITPFGDAVNTSRKRT
jgi:hypothetical protein